jgi:hypothetical protein
LAFGTGIASRYGKKIACAACVALGGLHNGAISAGKRLHKIKLGAKKMMARKGSSAHPCSIPKANGDLDGREERGSSSNEHTNLERRRGLAWTTSGRGHVFSPHPIPGQNFDFGLVREPQSAFFALPPSHRQEHLARQSPSPGVIYNTVFSLATVDFFRSPGIFPPHSRSCVAAALGTTFWPAFGTWGRVRPRHHRCATHPSPPSCKSKIIPSSSSSRRPISSRYHSRPAPPIAQQRRL